MSDSQDNSTPSFSRLRRWNAAVQVAVAVAALLAVIVMLNYLSMLHSRRYYWTGGAAQPLSPLTHQVLQTLTNEVHVVVFYDPSEPLYPMVSALLNEYRQLSPKIVLETVDNVRDVSRALELREKYKLVSLTDRNIVIFDCQGRTKTISDAALSKYDVNSVLRGKTKEFKRTAFLGELLFTSAIVTVSEVQDYHIYFLGGHGEHDPTNDKSDMGYAKFAAVLRDMNVQLHGLNLLRTNAVPADCNLLIIGGPVAPLDADEVARLETYLNQGGRLLLLLNYRSQSGLDRMLAKWGVLVGDDVVRDPDNTQAGPDVIVRDFAGHAVTRTLAQASLPVIMAVPRSVSQLQNGPQTSDSPQVVELAHTGPNGTAYVDVRRGTPYPSSRDRHGAIPLMVAVEKGTVKDVKVTRGSTRIIVTGDSIFLDNQMIDAVVNRDFAWQSVQWLLDRSLLMGDVGMQPLTEYQILVTQTQMQMLRWILVGALPGGILVFGLLIWWRRQS